jgi:hypothetical protein
MRIGFEKIVTFEAKIKSLVFRFLERENQNFFQKK